MECPNCGNLVSMYSERCRACGKVLPPGQRLLEESGVIEPPTPVETARVTPAAGYPCAGLGDRLIAMMLDSIVVLAACTVVTTWSFRRWGIAGFAQFHLTIAALAIAAGVSAAILFLYLSLMEAAVGATLGKLLVGIRVVRTDYRNALAISAIRNLLRIIDGIGFYFVGGMIASCTQLRQRLGDIFAGTVVVQHEYRSSTKALALVLWLAALGACGWGLPRVWAGPLSMEPPRYFGHAVVHIGYTGDSAYLRVSHYRVDVQRGGVATPPANALANADSR